MRCSVVPRKREEPPAVFSAGGSWVVRFPVTQGAPCRCTACLRAGRPSGHALRASPETGSRVRWRRSSLSVSCGLLAAGPLERSPRGALQRRSPAVMGQP